MNSNPVPSLSRPIANDVFPWSYPFSISQTTPRIGDIALPYVETTNELISGNDEMISDVYTEPEEIAETRLDLSS
jgi:hypothetical protein